MKILMLRRIVGVICLLSFMTTQVCAAPSSLSDSLIAALEGTDANATAESVIVKAGFKPGQYTRAEVFAAFDPILGEARMADLAARMDHRPLAAESTTVSAFAIRSIEGNQYAGPVLLALAAVAALVALSGCASIKGASKYYDGRATFQAPNPLDGRRCSASDYACEEALAIAMGKCAADGYAESQCISVEPRLGRTKCPAFDRGAIESGRFGSYGPDVTSTCFVTVYGASAPLK